MYSVTAVLGITGFMAVIAYGPLTGQVSGERCFYPAEWYSESQGKQWSGTLNCKSDMTDCREDSESGPSISGPTFTGTATSCYGGTSGSDESMDGNMGTMDEWCEAQRNGTCEALCDQYADTMSADEAGMCVDGCKTMSSSMCDGGGSTSGTSGTSGTSSDTTDTTTTEEGNTQKDPCDECVKGCGGKETQCFQNYCQMCPDHPSQTATETSDSNSNDGENYGDCGNNADSGSCSAQPGCAWQGSYCTGDNYSPGGYDGENYGDCGNNADSGSCSAQPGCAWQGSYCTGDNYSPGGDGSGGSNNTSGSMKNCFYPNATINGSHPGFTVWCEGDYVNCHKGDPSGASVSTSGLSLGAPSTCDSGWEENRGSGDESDYNDKDYGNMEEWCAAWRSGACRQTCDKYGMQNDPGCVTGCQTMTESMCDGSYRGDSGGSKTCEQQCDEMESSFYSCTSNDPSPMCAGSISECKRRCGRDSYHPAPEDEGSYRGSDDEHSETYRRYDAPTNGTMSWGQCFAECSKGIPASDPRYEQCRRKCDGGGYQSPGMPNPQERTDTGEPPENRWEQGMSERPQEGERAPGRDPTEMCKRMEAESRLHGDPAIQTEIRTLVEECYATVRKLMESGTPAESQMRETMESFRWKFEKTMHSQWQRSACDDADRGIGEARSAITTFAPIMVRKVTASHPTIAKSLEGLLQKAHTILARAEQALKNDDCDAALAAMDEMDRNVRLPFEAAMKRAGISMDEEGDGEYSLVNYENQYTEIYQRSGSTGEPDAGYEEFKHAMKEKGYGIGDLNRLKTIDPKFMKLVAKDEGADVIKGSTGIDRANLEEILAAKDAVIAKLEEQVHSLQTGMATIVAGVARFTPHPSVAEKLEDLVQRASSLSPEQFREEFAAIDSETRTAAVEDGWTQFTDAYQFDPAQQWYAGPVNTMADEGIFNGVDPNNHVFGAGQEANGAELVTALARMVGMDFSATPASAYANALPDWAQNAGGTLDRRLAGSLDDYLAGEAGRGVTRQEIARLIAGLFGDDLPEADSSVFEDFTDTGDIPADVQENIAPVVSAGIITGQESDNGRAFDPNGTVTREQLATILSRVLPLLQGEEEKDDVPVKRSLRRSLHEASGVNPDAMPSVVEEASSGLQFDLSAITKMETSAVYARILQEISNIKAVTKNATPEERLEIWVPKLNATTNAKNSWEKLNVSDFYQPYKNIPTWKMNIEGKLMDKDVRTIKNLILNPTKVAQ